MRTHTIAADGDLLAPGDRRILVRLWRSVLDRFLLLPLGAAIALIWANTFPEDYFRFAHAAALPVNEIGMAFFLGLIAQEIFDALMPGGALRPWTHSLLPVIAAAGALAGSATAFLLYVNVSGEVVLSVAWPVATAVDIAAGYYILRLVYPRRARAVAFLLLLAVIADSVALIAVSIRDTTIEVGPAGLTVLGLGLLSATALRWAKVTRFWPYWLVSGTLVWLALYEMGLHPALALIPIVPLLPHDARRTEVFADRPDDVPEHIEEHRWNGVAQIALLLFGLVNAGVILKHVDTGTWAVVVAALAGRPLGILIAIGLAVAAGLRLPHGLRWPDLIVVALAATSGFTFALFLSGTALPIGAVRDQITIGALATAAGALVCLGAARFLAVGRYHRRA